MFSSPGNSEEGNFREFDCLGRVKRLWNRRLEGSVALEGGDSHVLWGGGMGSMAHRRPDCLPSMSILYNSWNISVHFCWGSRVADEPQVFLRLFDCYCFYSHWLVHNCFISSQRACGVSNVFLFPFLWVLVDVCF